MRITWCEAGTGVEVSGYESCIDHFSYRTSQPDLMRLWLCKRLCHSGAMPFRRTAVCKIKNLYWVMSCHLDGWVQPKIYIYIVRASNQVMISVVSRTLVYEDASSFPSRNVCGSQSWALTFSGSRSARSTHCLALIFVTSFSGMGEYPGQTIKGLCNKEETE